MDNYWIEKDLTQHKFESYVNLNVMQKNNDFDSRVCWLYMERQKYYITDLNCKLQASFNPSKIKFKQNKEQKLNKQNCLKISIKQYFYSSQLKFMFIFIDDIQIRDPIFKTFSEAKFSHTDLIDGGNLNENPFGRTKKTQTLSQFQNSTSKSLTPKPTNRTQSTNKDIISSDISLMVNELSQSDSFANYTIDIQTQKPLQASKTQVKASDQQKKQNDVLNLNEAFTKNTQQDTQDHARKESLEPSFMKNSNLYTQSMRPKMCTQSNDFQHSLQSNISNISFINNNVTRNSINNINNSIERSDKPISLSSIKIIQNVPKNTNTNLALSPVVPSHSLVAPLTNCVINATHTENSTKLISEQRGCKVWNSPQQNVASSATASDDVLSENLTHDDVKALSPVVPSPSPSPSLVAPLTTCVVTTTHTENSIKLLSDDVLSEKSDNMTNDDINSSYSSSSLSSNEYIHQIPVSSPFNVRKKRLMQNKVSDQFSENGAYQNNMTDDESKESLNSEKLTTPYMLPKRIAHRTFSSSSDSSSVRSLPVYGQNVDGNKNNRVLKSAHIFASKQIYMRDEQKCWSENKVRKNFENPFSPISKTKPRVRCLLNQLSNTFTNDSKNESKIELAVNKKDQRKRLLFTHMSQKVDEAFDDDDDDVNDNLDSPGKVQKKFENNGLKTPNMRFLNSNSVLTNSGNISNLTYSRRSIPAGQIAQNSCNISNIDIYKDFVSPSNLLLSNDKSTTSEMKNNTLNSTQEAIYKHKFKLNPNSLQIYINSQINKEN